MIFARLNENESQGILAEGVKKQLNLLRTMIWLPLKKVSM